MSLYFKKHEGYSRGTDASREQVNHHTGKMNDGALINKGRGPTKGNDGTCHDPISGSKSAKGAPVSASGKEQKRGPGGVTAKCPANPDRQNVGRGPTKGNQQ